MQPPESFYYPFTGASRKQAETQPPKYPADYPVIRELIRYHGDACAEGLLTTAIYRHDNSWALSAPHKPTFPPAPNQLITL